MRPTGSRLCQGWRRARQRVAALLGLGALLAGGCDGFGRPIVGRVEGGDAGEPRRCEATPACRELRTVPADSFDLPAAPPELETLDCDGDSVDDALDNCLGVPNPTQGPEDCFAATHACEQLRMGTLGNFEGVDLRGCRIEEPLELNHPLSLRGAQLNCTELSFATSGGEAVGVDFTSAQIQSSRLSARAADAPLEIDLSSSTLRQSSLTIGGAASVLAGDSVWSRTGVWIDGGAAVAGPPSPAFDARASNFDQVTIAEPPSTRAGRVRIDRSAITASAFAVSSLELLGADITSSRIAAVDLDAFEVDLTRSMVRLGRGSIASSTFHDVIFDGCGELRMSDCQMDDVDIPACESTQFRAFRTEFLGANVGGGLELVDSAFRAGVLGEGPASTLVSQESEIDGVRFCDLGGAAFYGGEIRCVSCAENAFAGGANVCLGGTRLFERGCPAIELAASCVDERRE